jgi:serine/threonine protein kinase
LVPQIIHRDIKPGNLLLTKDGQLKVADFGVSYMYDGEDDTVQSSAGTAAFLAPEICSGQGASGKMVDLWATGVTLYMMLTGHVPFMAPTLPEIYEKIKNEEIAIPDGVNPAAADLIMRLLHKDPALRLSTKEAKVVILPFMHRSWSLPQCFTSARVIYCSQRHPFLNPGGVPNISKFVSQAFVPIVATDAEVEAAISKISTIEAVVVARRLSLRLLGRTRSSIQSKSVRFTCAARKSCLFLIFRLSYRSALHPCRHWKWT